MTRRVAYASSLSLAVGCSFQDFDPLLPGVDLGGAGGDGGDPGVGGDGGSGSNGGSGGNGNNGGSAGEGGSAGTQAGDGGSAGTAGGGSGSGGGGAGPTGPLELMNDGSFESTPSGWQAFGSATLTRVQTEAHTGNYSLLCANRLDEWHGASIPLPFLSNPAAYYTVSGWLRLPGPEEDGGAPPVPSASITISLKTKCQGDLDDTAGQLYSQPVTVQVEDSWVFFTGNTQAPNRCVQEGSTIIEYRLFIAEQQGPVVFTDFYVDDVSIVKNEP